MTQDDATAREARDLRYGLEEALDGELPGEMVERMARHTQGCPECAEEWERLRRIKELVRRSCAEDRKSTRLNSSHVAISYAVFCLKKNNSRVDSIKLRKR